MKGVIIDKQQEIDYNGMKVKVPMILLAILGILRKKHKQKFDDVILITGEVGSAKSTMSQLIAGLWQYMNKKELTIENFTWSAQGIVDFIDAEGNDNEAIVYDEAITGGTGRASLTKEGNMLKIGLVVGRRKRHLYIMIVDELYEFSKKIISRASFLIDMRTLLVRGEKTRGYFKIYNEKQLKDIYWLLKEQRIKYISEYNGRITPFYKFRDVTDIFINEEDYENEKIKQTRQQEKLGDRREMALVKALGHLKKIGMSNEKIGKLIDYSTGQVGAILRSADD